MSIKDYSKTFLNLTMSVDTLMELLGLDGDFVNVTISDSRDFVDILVQMNDGTGHTLSPGQFCESKSVFKYENESDTSKTKIMYYMNEDDPVIIRTDVESKIKKGKKLL